MSTRERALARALVADLERRTDEAVNAGSAAAQSVEEFYRDMGQWVASGKITSRSQHLASLTLSQIGLPLTVMRFVR